MFRREESYSKDPRHPDYKRRKDKEPYRNSLDKQHKSHVKEETENVDSLKINKRNYDSRLEIGTNSTRNETETKIKTTVDNKVTSGTVLETIPIKGQQCNEKNKNFTKTSYKDYKESKYLNVQNNHVTNKFQER